MTATVPPPVETAAPTDPVVAPLRKRRPIAMWLGVIWLALVMFLAVFADYLPFIRRYDQRVRGAGPYRFGPGNDFWFGADQLGRDMFARCVYGAQTSLRVAVVSIVVGLVVGGTLGVLAGYFRGTTDRILSIVFDTLLAFPILVIAILVIGRLDVLSSTNDSFSWLSRTWSVTIVLGVLSIAPVARIVRAQTMSIAQREYVLAARSVGAKRGRIIMREIVPNLVPAMMSVVFTGIAVLLVAEGGLAFLGYSVKLPSPTWGLLVSENRQRIEDAWWATIFPCLMFFATVLSFNVIGDHVARRFDIREAGDMTAQVQTGERQLHDAPLIEVTDLKTHFRTAKGIVRAVDGVTFSLERGKSLGIVGESGSGKTILSRTIMGLIPSRSSLRYGSVRYNGDEISGLDMKQMRRFWGQEMSMIFQDPMTSLNPLMTIGRQIAEPLRVHLGMSRSDARSSAERLLADVGIPEPSKRLDQYPHELSGGMRQRVMIAIALACGPTVLFADEPTTALDVTVQAQILDLIQDQRRDRNMSVVLVTHDLGVVAQHTDEIAVMYAGQIVEKAPTHALFANMRMPYTEALMRSIPKMSDPSHTRLSAIGGRPPDLVNPPTGCRFAARCPYAQPKCLAEAPPLAEIGASGHHYRCWYPVGSEVWQQVNLRTGNPIEGVVAGAGGH